MRTASSCRGDATAKTGVSRHSPAASGTTTGPLTSACPPL